MVSMIINKKTTKEAWDAITIMRVGEDCVKKMAVPQLRWKFDLATFEDDETVEDYASCLNDIVVHLTTLGEEVKDSEIVI
jgi:hypothetical protein